MGKLAEIVALFQKEGKNELPVAIIQDGTTSREKVGIGTVDTILDIVKENELSNPAIIVLGEVVKHREALKKAKEEYSRELIAVYMEQKRIISHFFKNQTVRNTYCRWRFCSFRKINIFIKIKSKC